jgi:hypothetical protein
MAATYFQGAVKQGENISDTAGASFLVSGEIGSLVAIPTSTGALNYDLTFTIPKSTRILRFFVDTTTAWTPSGTAVCTIGTTAGGTEYVSGFDVKTITRGPTAAFTAAQLGAMFAPASQTLVVRIAVSAASAVYVGTTRVVLELLQLD